MSKPARRDFLRWARLGAALALSLDLLLISNGHLSVWQPNGLLGGFFDAQGRALLRGSLAVPPPAVSFEGFRIGGQTFMYFGIVPALLRLPVLLVTHRLDGRLTQVSMLLAVIVATEAAARLHWHVRERIRPGAELVSGERGLVALLALGIGAGLPLYLVSWASVYHEAELWGLALSLAALSATLALIDHRSPIRILGAAGLCALAVNARISVGLGPVVTLALLGAAWISVELRRGERSDPGGAGGSLSIRALAPGLLAVGSAMLALTTEIVVNLARFRTPLGLPMYHHVAYAIDPVEHAAVNADHGAVFGLQFLPTTLVGAIRPDALTVTHTFPFLGLPAHASRVIGSALFVARLPSLSLLTAMPLLVVLTVAGLRWTAGTARARPLALGLIGSAVAFVATLTVSSMATRYLGDAVPMLALGACASLQSILARGPSGLMWAAARGGLVVLAVLGILIDAATGLTEQRLLAPTTSSAERAAFVGTQLDVASALGLGPPRTATGAVLPVTADGAPGDLFVVGHCAGLYVTSATGTWLNAERGRDTGLIRLRAGLPHAAAPTRILLAAGPRTDRVTITVTGSGAGPRLAVAAGGRILASGSPLPGLRRGPMPITISFDALGAGHYVSATVAGRRALPSTRVAYRPGEPVTAGSGAGALPGVRILSDRVGVCERLARADGRPASGR